MKEDYGLQSHYKQKVELKTMYLRLNFQIESSGVHQKELFLGLVKISY